MMAAFALRVAHREGGAARRFRSRLFVRQKSMAGIPLFAHAGREKINSAAAFCAIGEFQQMNE